MGPIFNEIFVEKKKEVCWSRKQCTGPTEKVETRFSKKKMQMQTHSLLAISKRVFSMRLAPD